MNKPNKFFPGDRVKLKADLDEEFPEEIGTVEESSGNGCYVVFVDDVYREGDEDDDGMREVEESQMELMKKE
jgi:hypothetical protein